MALIINIYISLVLENVMPEILMTRKNQTAGVSSILPSSNQASVVHTFCGLEVTQEQGIQMTIGGEK